MIYQIKDENMKSLEVTQNCEFAVESTGRTWSRQVLTTTDLAQTTADYKTVVEQGRS